MRVEDFPSFLSLEKNEMAEALRRLQEKDAVARLASGEPIIGWAEWPAG